MFVISGETITNNNWVSKVITLEKVVSIRFESDCFEGESRRYQQERVLS